MMNIKVAYTHFKQWQLDPFKYKTTNLASHHCNNCGNDFEGNFCPICSQKGGLGRITWKTVAKGIAELWGMNTRSLVYSLVQLFLRPGYFISDYISGKRQVSFPPVKMLAIISLLGIIVDSLTGSGDTLGVLNSNVYEFNGDKMLFLDNAVEWMNTHPDLMSMIILSYLIIPNYFIFRFAPRNSHHTLPQGFFIQVFSAIAFLVINMIYDITSLGILANVLSALFLFFTYKQLFGYGIWGTLWRLIATFTAGILLASIMLWLDYCIHLYNASQSDSAAEFIIFELLSVIAFIAILWISYLISKPRAPKKKAEPETYEAKSEPKEKESEETQTGPEPLDAKPE